MDRSRYPTRLHRDGPIELDDTLRGTTPEQRLEMMWPLVIDTWAFMGKPVGESRLQRHVVRLIRGKNKRATGRPRDLADADQLEKTNPID